MSSGVWRDSDQRTALYGRVAEALEGSARLAAEHAERELRRDGRSRLAVEEQERARRAAQLGARAMLR